MKKWIVNIGFILVIVVFILVVVVCFYVLNFFVDSVSNNIVGFS